MSDDRQDLIDLTHKLLTSIATADWKTYASLCDANLSAFEPEGRGHLIEGMDFHKFYFDLGAAKGPRHTTISSPHVRLMGDVGVVSYVRLVQSLGDSGSPRTSGYEETRVWQRVAGKWQHVHFHRSACP